MATKQVIKIEVDFDDNGAIRGIKQMSSGLDDIERTAGKTTAATRGLGMSVQMLGGAVAALGLGVAAREIASFGVSAVQTAANFETLRVTLNGVTGSVEAGGKAMKWIETFTATTPYQLEQVSKAFIGLRAQGIDPMDGTLKAIGDAVSMFAGGSAEKLESVTRGFIKMKAQGKITMESLQIMADAQIPVFEILKKQLNLTGDEIANIGTKGISANVGIAALTRGMNELAGGAMIDQMNTLNGMISNLQDNVTQFMRAIGDPALPAAKEAIKEVNEWLSELQASGAAAALGEALAEGITSVLPVLGKMLDGLTAVGALMAEIMTLKADFQLGQNQSAQMDIIEKIEENSRKLQKAFDRDSAADVKYYTEQYEELQMQLALLQVEQDDLVKSGKKWSEMTDDLARAALGLKQPVDDAAEAVTGLANAVETGGDGTSKLTFAEGIKWIDLMIAEAHRLRDEVDGIARDTKDMLEEISNVNAPKLADAMGLPTDGDAAIATANAKAAFEEIKEQWEATAQEMRNAAVQAFGGLLSSVIKGDFENIEDAFSGFSSSLADMFANNFANAMMAGMQNQQAGGEGGFMGGFTAGGGAEAAMGMGGAMLGSYSQQLASKGDRSGAIVTGVLAGAAQGFAVGNVTGAIIGAVAGGVMAYLSSGDSASPHMGLDFVGGGFQVRPNESGDIDWSPAGQRQFMRDLNQMQREQYDAFRDVLVSLAIATNNPDLMTASGGGIPNYDFGVLQGGPEEIAQMIENEWIPSMLDALFGPSFREGLRDLGVGDAMMDALFEELEGFDADVRLEQLQAFISAIATSARLLSDMDFGTMMEEVSRDSMTSFLLGLEEIALAVDVMSRGWEALSLTQRAEELGEINDLVAEARQAEIAMLQQIQQLQDAINASINAQVEGLMLGGMNEMQQLQYAQGQVDDIMAGLAGGMYDSPEEVQQAMADLQRYVAMIERLMGDQMDIDFGTGTMRENLIAQLEEARALAFEQLDAMRDKIQEANQALVDALYAVRNALIGEYRDQQRGADGQLPGGAHGSAGGWKPGDPIYINIVLGENVIGGEQYRGEIN